MHCDQGEQYLNPPVYLVWVNTPVCSNFAAGLCEVTRVWTVQRRSRVRSTSFKSSRSLALSGSGRTTPRDMGGVSNPLCSTRGRNTWTVANPVCTATAPSGSCTSLGFANGCLHVGANCFYQFFIEKSTQMMWYTIKIWITQLNFF